MHASNLLRPLEEKHRMENGYRVPLDHENLQVREEYVITFYFLRSYFTKLLDKTFYLFIKNQNRKLSYTTLRDALRFIVECNL